ncbi:MAG: glycosyltransferase family 4 protein [Bacteroidia bacterium]|nr:glycosyltransferase family 4 protein [Bacteroidia bacterium]
MGKSNIVYWDTGKSTFVLKDIGILSENYHVKEYTLQTNPKWMMPLRLVAQFIRCLFTVPTSCCVVVQFAGYHSYIPFVVAGWFGKKRVLVAGGTDCVSFPSISYGNFQRNYLKWFTARSFKLADLILPVHESLIDYKYEYECKDFPRQGYRNFVSGIRGKEVVIPNGYDLNFWKPSQVLRKRKTLITVGANLHSRFACKLKGIDLYVETAKLLPDYTFAIVGGSGLQIDNIPENIVLLENVPNSKLPELYSQYTFYCQLSVSEGFPNALSEAILCGCVPLVTNVGAMPMIVEENDNILKSKDPRLLADMIRKNEVKYNTDSFRISCAKRFPIEVRTRRLLEEIRSIVSDK